MFEKPLQPENFKPEIIKEASAGGEKLRNFYKKITGITEREYPDIMREIQEVAKKVGFGDVLINPLLSDTAEVDPKEPDTVLWARKSIENINILRRFAPEFSSKGIRIVTIHEKEHLRESAKEIIGTEKRFAEEEEGLAKAGDWKGVEELHEKLSKIGLFGEHQTRLQSLIRLEKYRNLFKEGKYPDIAEAIVIEEVFADFASKGPASLEEKISDEDWREHLLYFKPEFIAVVIKKDREIRQKLLKDYQSWQKEQIKS